MILTFPDSKTKTSQSHINNAIGGHVSDGGDNPAKQLRHKKFDEIKILW